jgi:hypothetical protein
LRLVERLVERLGADGSQLALYEGASSVPPARRL